MKKLILSFLFGLFCFLPFSQIAEAQPITTKDVFSEFENEPLDRGNILGKMTTLIDYTDYEGSDTNRGELQFRNVVEKVVKFLRRMMIWIAVLFSAWSGLHLVASRTNQELLDEKKRHIYSMATGFVVLLIATVLVDEVFFGEYGEVLQDEETIRQMASRGVSELQGIFRYVTTFVVAVAVGFLIFSAIKLIVAAGEREEEVSNIKRRMVYTLGGMALIVSSETFVRIFMREGKLSVPDIPDSIKLIADWANFILGIIGVLAVFGIVYAGIRLITGMGIDEEGKEDAKRILTACVIGLVVAFSAWTLMYYFMVPY
ncbi:pilin [Candidatus Gracilibacteria bacterium]|nr:pilin [Candidatus Gracilibacteria bacterium]MCF7819398.1 pilin [Candidatus Gracilibacteria bacterium]